MYKDRCIRSFEKELANFSKELHSVFNGIFSDYLDTFTSKFEILLNSFGTLEEREQQREFEKEWQQIVKELSRNFENTVLKQLDKSFDREIRNIEKPF